MEIIQNQEELKKHITDAGYQVPANLPAEAILLFWKDKGSTLEGIKTAINHHASIITDYYPDELPTTLSVMEIEYFTRNSIFLETPDTQFTKDIAIIHSEHSATLNSWLSQAIPILESELDQSVELIARKPDSLLKDLPEYSKLRDYKTIVITDLKETETKQVVPYLLPLNATVLMREDQAMSYLRDRRVGGNFRLLEQDSPSHLIDALIEHSSADSQSRKNYSNDEYAKHLFALNDTGLDLSNNPVANDYKKTATLLSLISDQHTSQTSQFAIEALITNCRNILKSKKDHLEQIRLQLKLIAVSYHVQNGLLDALSNDAQESLMLRLLESVLISNARIPDKLKIYLKKGLPLISAQKLNIQPDSIKLLYVALINKGEDLQAYTKQAITANSIPNNLTPILFNAADPEDIQWIYPLMLNEYKTGRLTKQNFNILLKISIHRSDFESLDFIIRDIIHMSDVDDSFKCYQINQALMQGLVYLFKNENIDALLELADYLHSHLSKNHCFTLENPRSIVSQLLLSVYRSKTDEFLASANEDVLSVITKNPPRILQLAFLKYHHNDPANCSNFIQLLKLSDLKDAAQIHVIWVIQRLLKHVGDYRISSLILQKLGWNTKYSASAESQYLFKSLALKQAGHSDQAQKYLELAMCKIDAGIYEVANRLIPGDSVIYQHLYDAVDPSDSIDPLDAAYLLDESNH